MEYQSVITEAWKLFKEGKKFTIFLLGAIAIYLVITFVLGLIGGIAILANNPIFTNVTRTGTVLNNTPSISTANINALIIIPLLCIFLIGAFIIWIIQTGVYKAFADKYKERKDMTNKEIFRSGLKYFLKIFIAQLLVSIPLFLITFLLVAVSSGLGIGTYSASPENAGSFALITFLVICCGIILIIPLFLFFAMLNITIQNAILIDNMGIIESISFSFKFVKKAFGKMIVLLIIGLFIAIVVSVPLLCVNLSFGLVEQLLNTGLSVTGSSIAKFPGSIVNFISQLIQTLYSTALSIYFICYWIVSYIKIKKLGEASVKASEPVAAHA